MPVSIESLFKAAKLTASGCVSWGEKIPLEHPGVYIVSTTPDIHAVDESWQEYPYSLAAIQELLETCPDLSVDLRPATAHILVDRLSRFWLPHESVLYIGLAGTSVARRVADYYQTRIGARSPHSGGWWLKTLLDLNRLFVHYAPTDKVATSENAMLQHFAANVPAETREAQHDPLNIAPFANVEVSKKVYKSHGLLNYKVPKSPSRRVGPRKSNTSTPPPPVASPTPRSTSAAGGSGYEAKPVLTVVDSQPITAKDRNRSNLRIPSRSKYLFPAGREVVTVEFRDSVREMKWNPSGGRSGLLGVGVEIMRTLQTTDDRVRIASIDARKFRIIE